MKAVILLGLAVSCSTLLGCQQQDVAGQAQAVDGKKSQAQEPEAEIIEEIDEPAESPEELVDDEEVWTRITRLYEQAKSSGTTAAGSASEWLSEMYGQADDWRNGATASTLKWVEESYAEAQRRGETTATSAKEWVMGDLRRVGTWEYKTLVLPTDKPEDIERELNALGADRWECFWVDKQGTQATFYLKRSGRSYLRNLPARELFRLLPLLPSGGDDAQ